MGKMSDLETQRDGREQTERDEAEMREFHEFGARKHWMIDRVARGWLAWRTFTYHCAQAAVRIERPDDPRRKWEAGLYVPFLVGAQEGHNDPRFGPARDWALLCERVLELPLLLERAPSVEQAEQTFKVIDRAKCWPTMCLVFDISTYRTLGSRRARLLEMQAPHLIK